MKDGSSQKYDIQTPFVEVIINEVQPYNPVTAIPNGCSDEARGFRAVGTPLHYAIHEEMMKRVEFLLMKVSDVRVAGRGGVTALQLAKQTGKEEMVVLIDGAVDRAKCAALE